VGETSIGGSEERLAYIWRNFCGSVTRVSSVVSLDEASDDKRVKRASA